MQHRKSQNKYHATQNTVAVDIEVHQTEQGRQTAHLTALDRTIQEMYKAAIAVNEQTDPRKQLQNCQISIDDIRKMCVNIIPHDISIILHGTHPNIVQTSPCVQTKHHNTMNAQDIHNLMNDHRIMTEFELTHCGHIYTTEMNKNTTDVKAAVEHLHVNFFRECMNSKTLTRNVRKTLQHLHFPTTVGLHSVPTNKGDTWFAYRLSTQERRLV